MGHHKRPSAAIYPVLLVFFSFFGFLTLSAEADQGWKLVKHGNRDYVTGRSLKNFYQFEKVSSSGNTVRFYSEPLTMTAYANSQTLIVNKVKFILSYPVLRRGGDILLSRTDLTKLVDPVLRPTYIQQQTPFETVVIDPGHGGHDTGSTCALGTEAFFNLDTARHLKRALMKRKLRKVYLTRNDNRFVSLGQRVKIANSYRNAIFISLHYNHGQSSAKGIETFALSPQGSSSTFAGKRKSDFVRFTGNVRDSENIALATAIHASVMHKNSTTDRGIKRARWTVLTGIKLPGILFEGGFLSNRAESSKISQASYRKELADAIADGIMNYRVALSRKQ